MQTIGRILVEVDVPPFTAILAMKKKPVNTPVVEVVVVAPQKAQK